MKRVMIASPFRGDEDSNKHYARMCVRHSFSLGEAPWAPHLIYTQMMSDAIPEERDVSIAAGIEWAKQADILAVYIDRGISGGMQTEIDAAKANGVEVKERHLPGWREQLRWREKVDSFTQLFVCCECGRLARTPEPGCPQGCEKAEQ